ncbi:signal peptidase I [Arthrobacter sp. ISL-65]|uniref:signal peptidase I n=1 Tax=Arthrobacter sp. ISL-65 TaxID=2819112 RepID=UPI001BEC29D7|nr:signal peptidase I [Arthrobacter sp. ISL-65]MBT2549158.1 signal peptidase I [Arthrobacter sp. ISL-65]
MGKVVPQQVPQLTGRDFGGRRGGGAATRILQIRRRRRFGAARRWANFSVLLVIALAALVLVAVPHATGSHTYTVHTESMAPKYSPGTFLVVKPVAFSQLKYGDVVTYQPAPGRPEVRTHRIVGFGPVQEGERTLITRGDHNDANDADPVRARQIKGKLWYAVPIVGYVAEAVGSADRGFWMTMAATGLSLLSALLIVPTARRRRREA